MTIRRKCTDPDFRRDPKTKCYCGICQKDLKPDQPRRYIMSELDQYHLAIHPDDWERAKIEIPAARAPQYDTPEKCLFLFPIGMDCARRLGLEWSASA